MCKGQQTTVYVSLFSKISVPTGEAWDVHPNETSLMNVPWGDSHIITMGSVPCTFLEEIEGLLLLSVLLSM